VGFSDAYLALDNKMHNYGFTTELHVKFKYAGGESSTFKGDDERGRAGAGERQR
jgi:hypothetical protein